MRTAQAPFYHFVQPNRAESDHTTDGHSLGEFDSRLRCLWGARRSVVRLLDRQIAAQAEQVLAALERGVLSLVEGGYHPHDFPQIRPTILDNGSFMMEWGTADWRLGFGVDSDPADSGWYLTSSRRLSEEGQYGPLSALSDPAFVLRLLLFVLQNS